MDEHTRIEYIKYISTLDEENYRTPEIILLFRKNCVYHEVLKCTRDEAYLQFPPFGEIKNSD